MYHANVSLAEGLSAPLVTYDRKLASVRGRRARIWPLRCSQPRRLTENHIDRMVFHMKTTLNISDPVMRDLKREAARQGKTMTELVETALRESLQGQRKAPEMPPLPEFDCGGALVDISDRAALYDRMGR